MRTYSHTMQATRPDADYYLAKAAEYRCWAQAAGEGDLQRLLAEIALEFLRIAKNLYSAPGQPTFH